MSVEQRIKSGLRIYSLDAIGREQNPFTRPFSDRGTAISRSRACDISPGTRSRLAPTGPAVKLNLAAPRSFAARLFLAIFFFAATAGRAASPFPGADGSIPGSDECEGPGR
jgi:hypothetical protein